MDPSLLIKEIGGGLTAVVIVAEALVIGVLYRRNNALQDKMFEQAQTVNKEMRDMQQQTVVALGANTEVMNRAIRETTNLVGRTR